MLTYTMNILRTTILLLTASLLFSCRATKKINKAIDKKTTIILNNSNAEDSIREVRDYFSAFKANYINYSTFSAKVKIESTGENGKNPDITAVVRMIKDSAIWVSLSATILNVEVYRILITKDRMILLNKQDKEVKYRSLDYLQEVTHIPFNFSTVQDVIVGNPIFISDSISAFRKSTDQVMIATIDNLFKNIFTLDGSGKLMLHSKMDDVDFSRNRTADIIYEGYQNNAGMNFSTLRKITASEKNKIDIKLEFKQYEFNKDVPVSLTVPKNYKLK
jgi:hypothetical protein